MYHEPMVEFVKKRLFYALYLKLSVTKWLIFVGFLCFSKAADLAGVSGHHDQLHCYYFIIKQAYCQVSLENIKKKGSFFQSSP